MAHVMKSTAAACGGLLAHYERELKKDGTHRRYGNQEIDLERTYLNYNLAPERDGGQRGFIKQRTSEVKCLKRDDVNVMCSWVVTAPKELPEKEHKLFFEESYKFLNDRYGHNTDKNVISAYVHMDETTPHMHYAFVPVVVDRKKGYEKVSAYEAVNRTDLQKFHPDLERHMEKVFGREIGILNEATKDGNKTVEELKRETKIAKSGVVELRAEKSQLEKEVEPIRELRRLKTKTEEIPVPKKMPMVDKPNMSYEDAVKAVEGNNAYIANEAEIRNIRVNRSKIKGREDIVSEREVAADTREAAADGRERELDEKEKELLKKAETLAIKEKGLEGEAKAIYAALREKPNPDLHVNFGYSSANHIHAGRRNIEIDRSKLAEKEKQVEDMYDTQVNLNQRYTEKTADFDGLWARYVELEGEFEKAQKTISHLTTQNGTLRDEISQMVANHQSEIKTLASTLKTQIKDTYGYMDAVVQSVMLLKYNWSNGNPNLYKVDGLTEKQDRLIDAISNYGAERAEDFGFDDLAYSMRNNMGLSEGMEAHIKALEPRRIDRRYDGPSL